MLRLLRSAAGRLRRSSYWRDIAWLASGSLLAQLIGVAGMPLLTRLYTPDHFALQNLFVQVVAFSVVLSTWRYEFFVQLPPRQPEADRLLGLVLLLAVASSVVATPLVWWFQAPLARWLGAPLLAPWLVLVPITAALTSVSVGMQNFVQRQERFRTSSLSEVANKSAYVGVAIGGHWSLPGASGLMLATAASALGKIGWLWSTERPLWPSAGRGVLLRAWRGLGRSGGLRTMARQYWRLSGSMVVSHLLMSCTAIIPTLFIARVYGTASLGQFALATMTIYLPAGLIGNAIGQVYYQRAAAQWAAGRAFGDLWRATAKRLVLIALPVYVALFLVAPWVYPILFGAPWKEAGGHASLLAIGAFFSLISSPLDRACLVVGAWLYIPLWHAARAVSTGLVAWWAWRAGWTLQEFVPALVVQMSLLFLIDYAAQYRFARRHPPRAAP